MTAATPPPSDPSTWTLPRLRITSDGEWIHDDEEVTHPGILANLRGNLRRDAQGYFIQTRVRIPVEVEDVPWVVTLVERRGDGLHAVLNDGSREDVDPGSLRMSADGVPYCAVKSGAFEARNSCLNQASCFSPSMVLCARLVARFGSL